MFIHAISFWILNVQEKILDDTFPLDENYLNDNYIVNWYKYGSPFNNLKKSEDKGVLPYILNITKEYLSNNNEFSINIDNLLKDTIKYIEENYTTYLENMKDKYELFKNSEKRIYTDYDINNIIKYYTNSILKYVKLDEDDELDYFKSLADSE